MTEPSITPTQIALTEALKLSAAILEHLELSNLPLANIAMKALRLARLLNDFEMASIFECEVGGYPTTPAGVHPDVFSLAQKAGRGLQKKEGDELKSYVFLTSIAELEQSLATAHSAMDAARDPDIAISSANPNQFVWNPKGNAEERTGIRNSLAQATSRLANRQAFIYRYAVTKHYELKYSSISGDVFSRQRERVDASLGKYVPKAIRQFSAVYENLKSGNSEDWSNAVHSCRRVLQELADSVFPPTESAVRIVDGKERYISLGKENYINRLVTFCEGHSNSKRFQAIVGSHLSFIGERLDAAFAAAQKGSHTDIVSQEVADRFVIYTYSLVGDILSLLEDTSSTPDAIDTSEIGSDAAKRPD